MTRVLFVCKKRLDDYGYSFGLFNSANFISKFLESRGIESKTIMAADNNFIDRDVTSYNPTHVIIEAIWVTPEKIRELLSLKRHRNRLWIVRIHSKIPFLANEGIAFTWLKEYVSLTKEFNNLIVIPNNKEVARDLNKSLGLKTAYLPNIYWSTNCNFSSKIKKDSGIVDVGCFGAIRPMKNQLIQAVAAIQFAEHIGKKLQFHINGNRKEQKGEQVLKNLRALFAASDKHSLVEHQWLPHDKFLELVKVMDVGMQVSLSETFNIVAADFVSCGVPVIGSPEIEWLPCIYTADPNSSKDIKHALTFSYKARKYKLHYLNNIYLYFYNMFAQSRWVKFLSI